MPTKCTFDYEFEEADQTWNCTREVEENKETCLLHDESYRGKDVAERMISELEDGKSEFIGISLDSVSLAKSNLQGHDSLYLNGADIGEININETKVPLTIVLDEASIGILNLSRSRFEFPVYFRYADIDYCNFEGVSTQSSIDLAESEISEGATFSKATVQHLDLRGVSIGGEMNLFGIDSNHVALTGVTVSGDTELSGSRIGELHCHEAEFKGIFESTRSTFEHATHFQYSHFRDSVDFGFSHLGGDVDFRSTTFDSEVDFLGCEFSISNFSDITISAKLNFSYADFARRVWLSLTPDSSGQVDMQYSSIDGSLRINGEAGDIEFDLTGISIKGNLRFDEMVASTIVLDLADLHSRFEMEAVSADELSITQSDLGQAFRARNLEINDFDMSDSSLESDFYIDDSNIRQFTFDRGKANGPFIVDSTEFDFISANSSTFSDLHLHGTEIDTGIDMIQAKFDSLHFELREPDDITWVNLVKSRIESGLIRHPSSNYAFFDLTSATIGDVDIVAPDNMDPLAHFQFSYTEFEGFDFSDYREHLEDSSWKFDQSEVDLPDDYETREIDVDELDDYHKYMYPDMVDPQRANQITYMKAKNGAKIVGDNRAASEFFIKEMRYDRSRLGNELKSSFPPISFRLGVSIQYSWISDFGDYLSNFVLDIAAGYGERLRRIAFWTLVAILGSTIYYSTIGGIRNISTGTELSVWSGNVFKSIVNSLYFSVVTFTTLGYGDYQPTTTLDKVVAGLEALVGVFLVGIFIYSLGKKISR